MSELSQSSKSSTISWPILPVGEHLKIVKVDPAGKELTTYPGVVISAQAPPPWIATQATWTFPRYDLNGLLFLPGDTLHEFFSPSDWFNSFTVFAPDGTLRGWYANVTYPTRLDATSDPYGLFWQDLYLDVVGLPDGRVFVRDEDELAASNLISTEPTLVTKIELTRDELLRRFAERIFPFHETDL